TGGDIMNLQEVRKRILGVAVGEKVLAKWPVNAVYYRAEVIGRSADFERYQVKFVTEEAPLDVSHADILMFPQLEMEFSGMPQNALVIGPLPDDLDEYVEEGGGKFLPGQVTASTVEEVTVRFINEISTNVPAAECIRVDSEFHSALCKEMQARAEEQHVEALMSVARRGSLTKPKSPSKSGKVQFAKLLDGPQSLVVGTASGLSNGVGEEDKEEVPLERPKKKRKLTRRGDLQ
ncbi:hypothetical protein HK097_006848, partial [Rhizophlyctis rosea]